MVLMKDGNRDALYECAWTLADKECCRLARRYYNILPVSKECKDVTEIFIDITVRLCAILDMLSDGQIAVQYTRDIMQELADKYGFFESDTVPELMQSIFKN